MAKLGISIQENYDSTHSDVKVTVTNDVADSIIEMLRDSFEIEMMMSDKQVLKRKTVIRFSLINDKAEHFRKRITEYYFSKVNGEQIN